jgi:hypothetical protein
MTTPTKFKLFGQDWIIRTGTDLELDTDLGRCVVDENLILLNAVQTKTNLHHTLTHEVIHSIEQKLHLSLTEQQVDLIALGLVDIMTTTPEMLSIFGATDGKRTK